MAGLDDREVDQRRTEHRQRRAGRRRTEGARIVEEGQQLAPHDEPDEPFETAPRTLNLDGRQQPDGDRLVELVHVDDVVRETVRPNQNVEEQVDSVTADGSLSIGVEMSQLNANGRATPCVAGVSTIPPARSKVAVTLNHSAANA